MRHLNIYLNGCVIINQSIFYYVAGVSIPFIFLPDMAQAMSISSGDAAFLISMIGISSIVGRLAAGFVAHIPCSNSIILVGGTMIVSGIASIVLPFWPQYAILVGFCVIFGASTGI